LLIYILFEGDKKCIHVFGELRVDNDYKQEFIARKLNVSRVAYSRYETGEREPPMSVFKELAKYYDTTIDYLVGKSNIKNPYKK